MRSRPTDPAVQGLLDEAGILPECAARDALLERAACLAEALDDLDTAWNARCRILGSTSSHESPKFEALFLCLAWCLAVSDREPERFSAASVLWQYKWVATAAPEYASVPRSVLERLIDDMDARFVREGWGRRAGLHKRIQLWQTLGEFDRARSLVEQWRATPRDRGSDCSACEASSMSRLLADMGDDEMAVREARPIILGRLTCATVPHSTFGMLLEPLARLGKHALARELYDKGRRLIAGKEEGGAMLAAPYLAYAGGTGEYEQALAILRTRLTQAAALRSDHDRMTWFGYAAVAIEGLARAGIEELDLPRVAGLVEGSNQRPQAIVAAFRTAAAGHAEALDRRNGNGMNAKWLETLGTKWGTVPGSAGDRS